MGAVPRPPSRRGWLIGGAIVAVLGIAGLAVGLTSLLGRGDKLVDVPPTAGLKINSISGRPGIQSVIISGDGRYLAYAVNSSGLSSVWVRQISSGSEVQVVPPQKEGIGVARFSPNGDYILYGGEDPARPGFGTMFQVSALGGQPRKLLSVQAGPGGGGVSLDGKQMVVVRDNQKSENSSAILLDVETGQEKTLATIASPLNFGGPFALSPDGKTFVSSIHTAEKGLHGQFVAMDTSSLAQTRFGVPGWEAYSGQFLPDASGFVVSAFKWGETQGAQLFYVSYPDGRYRRITNDSNEYFGLDVTADSSTIAAVRSVRLANLWSIPVEGKTRPKQLTFSATGDTSIGNFVVSPDNAIVYTAPTDHHQHVWTIGADGQNSRQLTLGTNDEAIFRTLPSGELVVSQMADDHTPHFALMDRDGGNPRPLARGTGEWLQDVTPDGKTLLYARVDARHELWSVPVAGGEPRKVTTSYNFVLSVSPDSRTIAYLTPQEMEGASPTTCIVAPIEGGAPIATFTWPSRIRTVKWMPDGKGLSFLEMKDNIANLFIQPLPGGPLRAVTRLTEGGVDDYLWSPDGKRVVLKRTIANVANLWSAGVDGRALEPITDFASGSIFAIDVAKDGKTIYFLYGNESNDIVLLKNFR